MQRYSPNATPSLEVFREVIGSDTTIYDGWKDAFREAGKKQGLSSSSIRSLHLNPITPLGLRVGGPAQLAAFHDACGIPFDDEAIEALGETIDDAIEEAHEHCDEEHNLPVRLRTTRFPVGNWMRSAVLIEGDNRTRADQRLIRKITEEKYPDVIIPPGAWGHNRGDDIGVLLAYTYHKQGSAIARMAMKVLASSPDMLSSSQIVSGLHIANAVVE